METLIFLIIIGVLSSIFGKGKAARKQTGKSFLPSGFEEIKTLINKQMEHTPLSTLQNEVAKPLKREETIGRRYLQVKETLEKEIEIIQAVPPEINQEAEPLNQMVKDEKEIFSEEWNSKAVLNGLIWSEVLGEPRSRKPYFPRKG
jgi:hypothetical protein